MIFGNNLHHYNPSEHVVGLPGETGIRHFYKWVYRIPAFPSWKEQVFFSNHSPCFYKSLEVQRLVLKQMKNPMIRSMVNNGHSFPYHFSMHHLPRRMNKL